MAWPIGGTSAFRIKHMAKLFGGQVARDFSGFIVKKKKVLYRHGSFNFILHPATVNGKRVIRRYPRLNFSNAFDAGTIVDYALLHASEPKDRFYLVPSKEFKALSKDFPRGRVNISARASDRDKHRLLIEPFEFSFGMLKTVLRS